MTQLNSEDGKRAYDLDRAHVFHSWSAQGSLNPFVIAGGSGSTIWDFDGNRYLDFSSQLVNTNLGHQHPAVVDAIKAQADILTTVAPPHANLARGEAAQRLLATHAVTADVDTQPGAVVTEPTLRCNPGQVLHSLHGGFGVHVDVHPAVAIGAHLDQRELRGTEPAPEP